MRKNIIIAILAVFALILSVLLITDIQVPGPNASEASYGFYSETDEAFDLTSVISSPIIHQTAETLISVPNLCQYPELPTGCESTAAAMVLQFYGEDITPRYFAGNWLECSEDFYTYEGRSYGPDPNRSFAGNPFSEYAYGCFASPIADAVNNNSGICTAKVLKNDDLEHLCEEYIDKGIPVLIWATTGMKESKQGKSWYVPDGSLFTWISGEHCLVLVGYNDDYYFLNDPQSGSTAAYQKNIVEQRFRELGSQAVLITKKS